MNLMLGVLHDEPILVIEPETRTGILARMSGVVDNFQLHTLLMDVFPPGGFISAGTAAVARGEGPQQTDDTVIGRWNLYTWRAIRPDFALPDASDYSSSDNWIWGEGVPSDIPVFEGRRAILLGPASYQRSWRSQRMFDALPASIEITNKITRDEVERWLSLMAAGLRDE